MTPQQLGDGTFGDSGRRSPCGRAADARGKPSPVPRTAGQCDTHSRPSGDRRRTSAGRGQGRCAKRVPVVPTPPGWMDEGQQVLQEELLQLLIPSWSHLPRWAYFFCTNGFAPKCPPFSPAVAQAFQGTSLPESLSKGLGLGG